MEHHLLQPQHLMASSGFFNPSNGSAASRFPFCGGRGFAAAPCGWEGEPGQLAGEMFGVGVNTIGALASSQTVWQCEGVPLDDPPPVCASIYGGDGVEGPPPAEQQGDPELATEPHPHQDDGNVLGTRKRKDRAKTIVLERKRRVRMTEKLYQLRSLVPNITKMDKASIIGDAVEYVRSLQSHATKLQEEVAALEDRQRRSSSSSGPEEDPQRDHGGAAVNNKRQDDDAAGSGHGTRVARVGATRVGEEGRFLVTVECERRDGAAARLCSAIELLACFRVESSSLGRSAPDRLVSTATLKATCRVEAATIGEGTVKLLMIAALGEEGFRIDATAGIS